MYSSAPSNARSDSRAYIKHGLIDRVTELFKAQAGPLGPGQPLCSLGQTAAPAQILGYRLTDFPRHRTPISRRNSVQFG